MPAAPLVGLLELESEPLGTGTLAEEPLALLPPLELVEELLLLDLPPSGPGEDPPPLVLKKGRKFRQQISKHRVKSVYLKGGRLTNCCFERSLGHSVTCEQV